MFNFVKNLGLTEVVIIGIVLLVFFGGKRAKSIAKTAGEATKEMKKVKKEYGEAVEEVNKDVGSSKKEDEEEEK